MDVLRGLTIASLALGLSLSLAPAQAKPEPISSFTVKATDTGVRASALVPGKVGRKAQLQQRVGNRWITVAATRTKRAKGPKPRARWTVPLDRLRSSASIQAGPLAELVRLRAKAGQSTSKPKKVRVTRSTVPTSDPTVPRLVGGDVYTQITLAGGANFVMSGRANWEFAGLDPRDPDRARYNLVGAELTWAADGADENGCTYRGGGTPVLLGGEGSVAVPPINGGDAFYDFRVRVDPALRGIVVTCPGNPEPVVFDGLFDLTFITTDCPSAGRIEAVYQSPPWSNQNFTWGFSGRVGIGKAGFCSNVVEQPGIYYQWSLLGVDPESATDLAPLRRK